MKNFMAGLGAVAMLALPVVLVTAPAPVLAEEALAETGFEEVFDFSALSGVSADRLSRQELHDTIGDGAFVLELTFWNGKASWNIATENEEPGVFPEQCGLAGCYDTCRGGSGECEIELNGIEDGEVILGGIGGGGRVVEFSETALMAMCGSPDECLLFPLLNNPKWGYEGANGPGTFDYCEGIDGCGPYTNDNPLLHGLAPINMVPDPDAP